MMNIENISKMFRVYSRRTDRLREWFSLSPKKLHQEFWALKDINFIVPKGVVFGIIGMNGAGKSTLLKILTGTTSPTSGKIKMEGRVAALLELGTGFHSELTGRENVLINGKLLGLTDQEIASRVDDIAAFSELGDFFDKPVRTYSSGMYVRLAFSLASSIDPDILIIDEALSVGDAYFQQKCLKKIRQFKERGVTILFVSHDAGVVKALCDRVALMDQGRILNIGDPQDLLEHYNALLAKKDKSAAEYVIARGARDAFGREQTISGNQQAEISKVSFLNDKEHKVEAFVAGDFCHIDVNVVFHKEIKQPTVGIMIRDRLGTDIFGTNTANLAIDTGSFQKGDRVCFRFSGKMNLGPGDYTVTAAVHSSFTHIDECYQWIDRILTFKVLPRADFQFLGVSLIEPSLQIIRA